MAHKAFFTFCTASIPLLEVILGTLTVTQRGEVKMYERMSAFASSICPRGATEEKEPEVSQIRNKKHTSAM